jgi:hypothetical protein
LGERRLVHCANTALLLLLHCIKKDKLTQGAFISLSKPARMKIANGLTTVSAFGAAVLNSVRSAGTNASCTSTLEMQMHSFTYETASMARSAKARRTFIEAMLLHNYRTVLQRTKALRRPGLRLAGNRGSLMGYL